MRRSDREIKDNDEIFAIIEQADVCRLALADNNIPYIVTMNFGLDKAEEPPILYFHCANEGKKLEIIARNKTVCFEFDIDHELLKSETSCGWSMNYRSVVGMGEAELVTDQATKLKGLNRIMHHYSGREFADFDEKLLGMTTIFKVKIYEISGKQKLT